MVRVKRPPVFQEAGRINREQVARLGARFRDARLRRQWTQERWGKEAGVSRMLVSRVERGLGDRVTVAGLQRMAVAVGIRLSIELARDPIEDTADAGHLAVQELMLRIFRRGGRTGLAELPTRPAERWRSADVVAIDDKRRSITVAECWNTFGDLGAAVRTSNRKVADAKALAVARWGTDHAPVGLVWIVRDTARNRALVRRYPEFFRSRFPGSSREWLQALVEGRAQPTEPGLVWCDVASTRLFSWRQARHAAC
jgi:transcriptional regulator with XRE-family HTH domain